METAETASSVEQPVQARDSQAEQDTHAVASPEPAQAVQEIVPPERLETIDQQLQSIQQRVQVLQSSTSGTTPPDAEEAPAQVTELAAIQDALAALEKQISRAGREQLKANSLAETKLERLTSALDMLREQEEQRTKELDEMRQQLHTVRAEARLEVVQALLPTLDSLDEALRSGQTLLERPATPAGEPSIFERLRGQVPPKPDSQMKLREAMTSWIVGLTFVRQRLLDVLAAEGVTPMDAQGQPFDAQLHVAISVLPASDEYPPGVVVNEIRRGYLLGDRVLRHAEVVVARPGE
jgi:molecular chaperone GrpE